MKDGSTKKYYSIAGMMVAMNDGSGLQYLLTDHLGSTVAVTNSSGTLTSQQRYLPFGAARTIPNSPILGTDFTYTGQRKLDDGMGEVMDYKARFYSVELGRFIHPDSIIPDQFNPQSWNRFSYVLNNPVRFSDPTGHKEYDEIGGGIPCYPGELVCQIRKGSMREEVEEPIEEDEKPVPHCQTTFIPNGNLTSCEWNDLELDWDADDKSFEYDLLSDLGNGTLFYVELIESASPLPFSILNFIDDPMKVEQFRRDLDNYASQKGNNLTVSYSSITGNQGGMIVGDGTLMICGPDRCYTATLQSLDAWHANDWFMEHYGK